MGTSTVSTAEEYILPFIVDNYGLYANFTKADLLEKLAVKNDVANETELYSIKNRLGSALSNLNKRKYLEVVNKTSGSSNIYKLTEDGLNKVRKSYKRPTEEKTGFFILNFTDYGLKDKLSKAIPWNDIKYLVAVKDSRLLRDLAYLHNKDVLVVDNLKGRNVWYEYSN
jgi:hypothetical protein